MPLCCNAGQHLLRKRGRSSACSRQLLPTACDDPEAYDALSSGQPVAARGSNMSHTVKHNFTCTSSCNDTTPLVLPRAVANAENNAANRVHPWLPDAHSRSPSDGLFQRRPLGLRVLPQPLDACEPSAARRKRLAVQNRDVSESNPLEAADAGSRNNIISQHGHVR